MIASSAFAGDPGLQSGEEGEEFKVTMVRLRRDSAKGLRRMNCCEAKGESTLAKQNHLKVPRALTRGAPLHHKLLVGISGMLICVNVYGETDLPELGQNAGKYRDVVVQDVVRADTIRLENGETVRLIGVRAFGNPARKKKISRDEYGFVVKEKVDLEVPFEEQAREFTQELLEGKHVRLEFDAVQKDAEYKTLAYVFLIDGNTFVNARILERGFADLQIQAPNLKYAQQLRDAYREGRLYSHGIDE